MSHRVIPAVSFPDRTAAVVLPGESVVHPTGIAASTVDHEEDARTALIRGMMACLATLSTSDAGGRVVKFATIVEGQSEPDDAAKFPWCSVMAPDEASYAGGMAPIPRKADRVETPRQDLESYVVETSHFVTTLHLTFVSNKVDRKLLMKMLERDLQYPDGNRGKYGVTVELPYYMGRRADYAPTASQYVDSPAEAARARFGGVMKVSASLSVARIVERPRIKRAISTSVE